MGLEPLLGILADAQRLGHAVGCFEVWDLYSMEAVLEAAEEMRTPVILGFGSLTVDHGWLDRGGLEAMGVLGQWVARRARVPVALFLNEAHTYDQVVRGILAGFNSVMLASWHLPFEDNVRMTQEVVRTAHAVGVAVEGELGGMPGNGDNALTNPECAASFVSSTGIDALAVSIGNVRLRAIGDAVVDLELLECIRSQVSVPLVIHGGTGFPRAIIPDAVRRGIVKFNVGTALKRAYLNGLGCAMSAETEADVAMHLGRRDPKDALIHGKLALKHQVKELITLYKP